MIDLYEETSRETILLHQIRVLERERDRAQELAAKYKEKWEVEGSDALDELEMENDDLKDALSVRDDDIRKLEQTLEYVKAHAKHILEATPDQCR